MRLLKRTLGGNLELKSFNDDEPPPYAILSHTWTEGEEVTYSELVNGEGKNKIGYAKIEFCVNRAAKDGMEYSWVDTCCINKATTDNELTTAINSMFRWYKRAAKCYVYLSDVSVPKEVINAEDFRITWDNAFRRSRWFTRGWTLQELLAPATVEFFSKEGRRLGSKISLEQEICQTTEIPVEALRAHDLFKFSVEERIGWAAKRTTKLKEDKVYCLLGIFGVFLSLIYGEGEAYATLRLKEEIQKRHKGQGTEKVEDLTVSSPLPFPRNEHFVGRADELQRLEQFLRPNTHRRMTIYGLGGCGKSALALEFAYRALARHSLRHVFWVPALSIQTFELAYREIGVRLSIPGITDDNANIKQLVKDTLSSSNVRDWLMVVDNADDVGVLRDDPSGNPGSAPLFDYLPYSDGGKILFTTRSRKAADDFTQSSVLEPNDIGKAEASELLARRITTQSLLNDEKAVSKLLEMLAYLPLAIVQAAAFMNSNTTPVSEYLSLFSKIDSKAELFGEQFMDPSRYQEIDSTIAKTWHISFDKIRKQDPLAAEYLSFMACIDRINIPRSLLPSRNSSVQQAKALGTLKGYAFITEHQQAVQEIDEERFFDMHRLVHMASVWWLEGHDEQDVWTAKAAGRLEELIPYGGHERKEVWTAYLPHAMHVCGPGGVADQVVMESLHDRVGRCQASLGQYAAAEANHRQVHLLREKRLGTENERTLMSLNEIGIALSDQGKYMEAEEIHRQTLATREEVLGKEHPSTLTTINNLAEVLGRVGKYEEAEEMHRQTLATSEKVLGKEHPNTLTMMNNLALVLDSLGKYEEAEEMHRQTLATREKVLGKEHPNTLTTMNNLALVLDSLGKYEEAEEMHRQTLATRKKVLVKEHPSTLTTMNNLAEVLGRVGKYEEAEEIHRQTLATSEKVLGKEHPNTLTTMNNLAEVLGRVSKYEEAEEMHRQTLATCEKVLGKEHPDTLTTMNNLALILGCVSKYEEAEGIHRQTLATCKKVLRKEHPSTLAMMNNLALVLRRVGKYEEAEGMYRQTLATSKKVLRKEHPSTLTTMNNLAEVLGRVGKYEEAEEMHRQTLATSEKVLGKEHLNTLTTMNNLALVLDNLGKYEEAEEMHRQTLATREKVLGKEHPDTLTSVYCLAHLLANQHRYSESITVYQRACTGYSAVLGKSHPTTRSCHEHYSEVLASQEKGRLAVFETANREVSSKAGKTSKLSRGLAKMGIRSAVFSK